MIYSVHFLKTGNNNVSIYNNKSFYTNQLVLDVHGRLTPLWFSFSHKKENLQYYD